MPTQTASPADLLPGSTIFKNLLGWKHMYINVAPVTGDQRLSGNLYFTASWRYLERLEYLREEFQALGIEARFVGSQEREFSFFTGDPYVDGNFSAAEGGNIFSVDSCKLSAAKQMADAFGDAVHEQKYVKLMQFHAHGRIEVLILKASMPVSAEHTADFEKAINFVLDLHCSTPIEPNQLGQLIQGAQNPVVARDMHARPEQAL